MTCAADHIFVLDMGEATGLKTTLEVCAHSQKVFVVIYQLPVQAGVVVGSYPFAIIHLSHGDWISLYEAQKMIEALGKWVDRTRMKRKRLVKRFGCKDDPFIVSMRASDTCGDPLVVLERKTHLGPSSPSGIQVFDLLEIPLSTYRKMITRDNFNTISDRIDDMQRLYY